MALKDYVKWSNKKMVDDLSRLTMTHRVSVYRWLRGQVTPPLIKQEIIAKYLNKKVEELFPQN